MNRITRAQIRVAIDEGIVARAQMARAIGLKLRRKGDVDWNDVRDLRSLGVDLVPALQLMVGRPSNRLRGIFVGVSVLLGSIFVAELGGWP